jgi:antitoxin VapB
MNFVINSARAQYLAEQLAEHTGVTVPEAVEAALEEQLARLAPKLTPEEKMKRIDELLAKLPPVPPGVTSDHSDLYDEDGLPA